MSVRSRRVGGKNDHVGRALQLCYVSTPQRSLPWSAGSRRSPLRCKFAGGRLRMQAVCLPYRYFLM